MVHARWRSSQAAREGFRKRAISHLFQRGERLCSLPSRAFQVSSTPMELRHMHWKLNLSRQWRRGAFGAALVAALGLVVLSLDLTQHRLRQLSYDLPFAFPHVSSVDDVVMVLMDEESYRRRNLD